MFFKTAVSVIELYRIRFGTYPETLGDIPFLGVWEKAALGGVKYEKLQDGYALDLVPPGIDPEISYPSGFWQGLGLRSTNVGRAP